ncbi:hypothetical protein ACH5RR_006366 [Cinchona calisaya]|uniref:Reverse transcriptase domain-containing protein n=1 Tax=Cinchona calisaya TaxID=153742 RepID=A0ABD3ANS7_9GENT
MVQKLAMRKRIYPFHINDSDSSIDRASSRHGQRNYHQDYGVKVDIPDFEGQLNLEDFIDWLTAIERVFNHKNIPKYKKVKIVAIKLKKHASIWWENLKRRRDCEGKQQIVI